MAFGEEDAVGVLGQIRGIALAAGRAEGELVELLDGPIVIHSGPWRGNTADPRFGLRQKCRNMLVHTPNFGLGV